MENIIKNTIAFGNLVIAAESLEISKSIIFTIEDDAYVYAFCPELGIFAYGNDISSAQDNLASAISINFIKLHQEGRIADFFDNPMEEKYIKTCEYFKQSIEKKDIKLIAERIINPENTETIKGLKKGPQLYSIDESIQLKIQSEPIEKEKIVA